MKKFMAVFLMLVVMLSWTSVNAASLCSYERQVELKKIASAVKLTYEEAQEEADPNSYISPESGEQEILYVDYFKLKILNISEEIYVKIENSKNDEVKYIRYEDTNEGTFTLDWKDLSEVVTFTYTIYTSEKTECLNEKLFSGIISIPMKNRFYTKAICSEIPEYDLCHKYTTINVDYNKFEESVNAYLEKKLGDEEDEKHDGLTFGNKLEKFVNTNKNVLLMCASIIFVVGVVTIVVVIRKRRSKVL